MRASTLAGNLPVVSKQKRVDVFGPTHAGCFSKWHLHSKVNKSRCQVEPVRKDSERAYNGPSRLRYENPCFRRLQFVLKVTTRLRATWRRYQLQSYSRSSGRLCASALSYHIFCTSVQRSKIGGETHRCVHGALYRFMLGEIPC